MQSLRVSSKTISVIILLLCFELVGLKVYSQIPDRTEQQDQIVKDKQNIQSQQQETPAEREKRLIKCMEKVKKRMDSLQSELNELRLRVLQNRPRNPLVFGDPYYVDPKLREQVAKVRRQLLETQLEFEDLVNEIEGR
ncbi:MAG: hypothetical protein AB1489_10725 [Acidobacteriota bacterium]